jgi:TolA-binding protein
VFTPAQISETRKGVKETPTSADNYKFRRALLEYWHSQLLREYKTLDVTGADTISVEYLDAYGATQDNVLRKDTLTVASDAHIFCVGPDMKNTVNAVIFGDQVRVKVVDPDMSRTPNADTLQVMVSSIPKVVTKKEDLEAGDEGPEKAEEAKEAAPSVDLFEESEEQEAKIPLVPEGAPSFALTLTETGPFTGEFVGTFPTIAPSADHPVAKLGLSLDRLIRVAYRDDRSSGHAEEWVVATEVEIVPGSEGKQEVIELREGSLDRRSELEKGIALGKLARVYQDLGLNLEARRTFDEALKVVKKVVQAEGDSPLGEEATYQMWDLYFASGDEQAAAEACSKLIATFPNSPLAPAALLIMGKAEKKNVHTALSHFQSLVNRYPDSPLASEAQFRIAELKAQMGAFDVAAYETCANKYPESNYAAMSLLALAEYYMDNKDYARAKDYLERITLDFPDFDKLDKTTYMRGVCAYRQGDIQLAYTLMHEVVEKYPGTSVATSASKIVELLAKKLKP